MKPLFRSNGSYNCRIIATAPLVYFPMDEVSGSVAKNWGSLGIAANGSYTGADLHSAPGPKGSGAPFFDGVNDFGSMYSAAFCTAFDAIGGECSIGCWCKVYGAAAWTESVEKEVMRISSGVPYSRVLYQRINSGNDLQTRWDGGGVLLAKTASDKPLDWFHILMTVSLSADAMRFYVNGVQSGTTGTGVQAWDGSTNGAAIASCAHASPSLPWHGWLAHLAIWNRALSADEISLVSQ
jgi:hypothetical protein